MSPFFFGQIGVWKYSLQASSQTLTLTVTSRASSATLPPVTVTSKMNKDTGKFPSPMVVYVKIHQGTQPILRSKVTALIESVDGKTVTLELLDNGAGNHPRNWTHFSFPGNNQATAGGHIVVRSPALGLWLGELSASLQLLYFKMLGNMRRACLQLL